MHTAFLEHLAAVDARQRARGFERASLDPTRELATPLVDIGRRVTTAMPGLDEGALTMLARGIEGVVEAIAVDFPDNIFADLDYLVAELAAEALASSDPSRHLDEQLRLATELHRSFGQHSPIRFRYVHDFIYGYDWANWVRRSPDERRDHGPFSRRFLTYTERRGRELLDLIAEDDARYHQLRDDETARNPFGFSREAEAERTLHRDLAARGLIPVPTWRFDARPRYDRDFAALRHERAKALGLSQ